MGQKTKDPLDNYGPFDLFGRETLERVYRRGGMSDEQARGEVGRLISGRMIKLTRYTGLLNGCPLYQKS